MVRYFLGLMSLVVWCAASQAEEAPRLKFAKGEVLKYRIEQTTSADEIIIDEKTNKPTPTKSSTKLSLIKVWTISEVDEKGIATLDLSLEWMKIERVLPNGEKDSFDSKDANEDNQAEMKRLVGPKLATLKMDTLGQLIEVKESKYGPASRFTAELPFKVTLPEKEAKEGIAWDRHFTIKLDPPAGTGETYATKQTYTMKAPTNGFTVININTTLKEPPMQANDLIPLLPMMLQGEVYFHAPTGRYFGARLKMEKTIENHLGEGTKYTYASTYVEDLIPKK